MIFSKLRTKFLLTATIIELSKDEESNIPAPNISRPTALPVYVDHASPPRHPVASKEICEPEPSTLQNAVSVVRKGVWTVLDYVRHYKHEAIELVSESGYYVESGLNYLSKECDDNTRKGAIGLSTVTGFVLGLRGGILRRLVYAGASGTGMAAICYPDLAKEYSAEISTQARKYSSIALQYYRGETPEDNENNFELVEPQEMNEQMQQTSNNVEAPLKYAERQ